MKSAETIVPSRRQHIAASDPARGSGRSKGRVDHDHEMPPITTESPPSRLQEKIKRQSWDKVSARHPIGRRGKAPDVEAFVDLVSTILETRLADVVRHRTEAKASVAFLGSSRRSSQTSEGVASIGTTDEDARSLDSVDGAPVLLSSSCRSQLRRFVRRVASMYRDNRYHGLEHAVHVTMSANKLLDMLHDGTVESDADDDDDCQTNDFSVSEPHIMSGVSYRPSRNIKTLASGDKGSDNPTSENGYQPAAQKTSSLEPHEHKPYLIYSDMFTKFAFVFAALIHDVDHQGVPNARLILENDPLVEVHGGISVAEKHSIKVAFKTLGEGEFDEFRSVIFESPDDRLQMHRIVSNVVVSTDIASPERMQSTKLRWEEAFSRPLPEGSLPFGRLSLAGRSPSSEIATVQASKPQLVSMKDSPMPHSGGHHQQRRNSLKRALQLNGAGQTGEYFDECDNSLDDDDARTALRHSVVMETMLNVADVAHSMQSWELFLFWNRKLYEELYDAYTEGRSGNDPSGDWYENQLGFYRLYVIPLAEKMRKCGAFGELGGEWVKNAKLIRDRWTREGEEVTRDMIASVKGELS